MVRASTEFLSWLGGNVHYFRGRGINYYPAEGLEPFLGTEQSVETGFTLRPYSRLRLDLAYLYSSLSTSDESALPPGAPRGSIFTDHILRTRVNYQFTRELSARVIFDYEVLTPEQALVDLEHERRFNADVLLTYLINPWTAIYVGYSDGYENRPLAPITEPPPSRADLPLTSVGRQVFVKLSYLFRY
jgi:predicted porin